MTKKSSLYPADFSFTHEFKVEDAPPTIPIRRRGCFFLHNITYYNKKNPCRLTYSSDDP